MRSILGACLLMLLVSPAALSSVKTLEEFKPTKSNCTWVKKRIEQINTRLRAGYRNAEGEVLKSELRELKTKRNMCKDAKLS